MAKNISRHITHLKSKVVESNAPKLPAAADLYEGEIAVNYAKGYETLSIKNESGTVVTFKSKDYNDGAYQAKGSYLTGTTNYAGSASQGGAATSANKLNSNAGSATQPIYFSNGVPSACTYTLGKSVPSNAVFTDNNTTYAAGSFITITGTNNSINVTTGTSSTSVARGDHSHSAYVATGRSISTASGLTGGGNLSADRTIGFAATGSAGTYSTVVVDAYGRVTSGSTSSGAPAAHYFIIGEQEGSESVPSFDAYNDTVHITAQNLSASQKTQARTNIGAVSISDISSFENKVEIATANSASLTAEVNKYYRYDSAVGTLAITLPIPSDTTHLPSIIFSLTTSSTTNVTFSSSTTIKYQDGWAIDASSSYEINAIYNGSYWSLAAIKFA